MKRSAKPADTPYGDVVLDRGSITADFGLRLPQSRQEALAQALKRPKPAPRIIHQATGTIH